MIIDKWIQAEHVNSARGGYFSFRVKFKLSDLCTPSSEVYQSVRLVIKSYGNVEEVIAMAKRVIEVENLP